MSHACLPVELLTANNYRLKYECKDFEFFQFSADVLFTTKITEKRSKSDLFNFNLFIENLFVNSIHLPVHSEAAPHFGLDLGGNPQSVVH